MYRIKRKAGFQFGCFIIITLFSMIDTVVFADDDIPESCTGTYEEIAYNAGEYRGEDLVTTAWEMISDCDRVEYFRTVILDDIERLTLPENASPFLVCRYAGYMNGAMKVINDIYEQCEDLCYEEGEIVGEIAAKVYCDLSLALGGIVLTDEFIRAPVQLCGLNYEFACDVTFMFTTFNYSNSIGSCEMYTFDPWEDTWDQWRNEQCGYNMIPPTP